MSDCLQCEHFRRREVSPFRCRHGLTTLTLGFAKGRICVEKSFKPLSVRAVGFHFQVPVGAPAVVQRVHRELARVLLREDERLAYEAELGQAAAQLRGDWRLTSAI